MILNKLYRLQRKKGAVLFVVIAMMTLLVIMATAAYMTARSSHQTVINNYDFSQVYLSTVSVSDMMIGAITQETVDNAASPNNNFGNLKAIITNETSFGVGKSIKARSSNIDESWTTPDQVLAGIANTTPVKNGILDAVQVVIDHESHMTKDVLTGDDKDKSKNIDYYLITTTGYYRNNTISIQDRIAREWGEDPDPDLFSTFFTATGKFLDSGEAKDDLERCAVIDTFEISDDAYFENQHTVFKRATTPNAFKGGITAAGNVWLEQFKCEVPNNSGEIPEDLWGIQYKRDSEGNIILDAEGNPVVDEWNHKVSGTRYDWFIGGSLIFGGANGSSFNIGNNNLIIMGDLIIPQNLNDFTANRVYVMGNVIDLSGSAGWTIKADLYVNGTVVTNLDTTTGSDEIKAIKQSAKDTMTAVNNACNTTLSRCGGTTGNLDGLSSTGGTTSGASLQSGKKFYCNDIANLCSTYAAMSPTRWDPTAPLPVEFRLEDPEQPRDEEGRIKKPMTPPLPTKYLTYVNYAKSVQQAGSGETGRSDFYSYTVKSSTMGNKLTINMDKSALTLYDSDGDGTDDAYKGEFWVNGTPDTLEPEGNKATVKFTDIYGQGEATISLPYIKDGYLLELKFINSPNHKSMTYTIENKFTDVSLHPTPTNEDILPIVLMANFNDGSGNPDDKAYEFFASKPLDMNGNPCEGNNAFAWNVNYGYNWKVSGDSFVLGEGDGSHATKVIIDGAYDVFFELGNYDATGAYKIFDAKKGYNTATYWTTKFSQVGTRNQINAVPVGNDSKDTLKALLKPGLSDPQDAYDNQVMIISNKSGGVAYNNNREYATVFGYLYAPFGDYSNWNVSKSAPFFGGMIVSNYALMQSEYVYAEPDPVMILKNLEEAFDRKATTEKPDDIWYVNSEFNTGTNFLG